MLLRPRITAAFLLTSVIPILLIGILTYTYVKSSIEQTVLEDIRAIAELKEANLYLYLESLKTTTRDFSSDGFIRDSIEIVSGNEQSYQTLNQHLIKNKLPLNKDILYIDILNTTGIVTSSTRKNRIGKDSSDEAYFRNSKSDIYINDIRRHDADSYEIEVAAPLFSRTNSKKLVGILVNHFTIRSLNNLFNGKFVLSLGAKTQPRGIGKSGETYVVNKDKLMINDSLYTTDASIKQIVDTYPVRNNIENGNESSGIWKDYRGIEVVGSSMSIEISDFRWTLISEQDADEAFSSVERLKYIYAVIILVVSVIAFITSLLISRKITQPIDLLTKELAVLEKGEELTRIKDIQNNDEIGYFAKTFERMSINLKKAQQDIQEKNKQLEELSNCDGLTGLYNHRYLKEILDKEFNRSYRYKTPLCCIMLDIDYFKSINDTYGHLFGDVVLKGVAAVIKKGCRKSDIAARYGGEEFVILLPSTDLIQAQIVVEKLFNEIKNTDYHDDKNHISITVSIGISSFHEGIKEYNEILSQADEAMYKAKDSGRNNICIYNA